MTILSILGLLVAIFGLFMLLFQPRLIRDPDSPEWLKLFTRKLNIPLIISGLFFFILNGMFFYNNAGTATSIQYLWGGDEAVYTQGIKLKWWGRTIPISYEIPIQDIIRTRDTDGNFIDELPQEEEEAIYHRTAELWEFADAIKAEIGIAVIIGIDVGNDEVFLNMADRNKTEQKLVYSRIMPNIDAALKNTCKLMDAQDYISGAASEFDRYFRDQLENGMYQTEEYYEDAELPEIIGDSSTVRKVTNKHVGSSSKQKKYKIKLVGGSPVRDNSNSLKQYGLKILQAQVTSIDWEGSFDKRLDLQKDQVAQTQLKKQEAEKEFYRTQMEIAKGEADKAQERAKLEKEQIQLTIGAETKAKVAGFKVMEEKELLAAAKLSAQTIAVNAEAEATKNRKLVSAGLTPQERMSWEYEIQVGVAAELAKTKWPSVYIAGGAGGKGSGLLETLIGADYAKKMLEPTK